MITLYGIPNCDTVKKARNWLDSNEISYQFHDFKKNGLDHKKAEQWLETLGPDKVVNKRSTTWKQLSDTDKSAVLEGDAASILVQRPTLIKRPVLEASDFTELGFKSERYISLFS